MLTGNDGDNVLTGGGGIDTMDGGKGSDTYVIALAADHTAAEIKDSGDTGIDQVLFSADGAGTLTLFAGDTGIETVVLATGTADLNVNAAAVVNALNITGNGGANSMTGTAYADIISAGAGNDTLIGGAGVDTMSGGAGDDLYIINLQSEHGAAEITDSSGTDEVRFASITAGQTLTLYAGDTGIDSVVIGTGVAAAAVITGTVALNVNAAAVVNALSITGNAGANILTGTAYNDTLNGGAGDDTLIGGAGADTMMGGAGNDTYYVDNVGDQVIESSSTGGTDQVYATASFALDVYVENLTLTGSGNINATGNTLANVLTGNTGANVLIGGLGNDTLSGGAGADFFVFNETPNATSNYDTVTDFVHGTDKLELSKAVFSALGVVGVLTSNEFAAGNFSSGQDSLDRIIYNTSTGVLYYDADGSGRGAAVAVALLGVAVHPTLDASDIVVIA